MNPDDHHHRDRIVDLLLWERVGEESPPDVRARVLEAVEDLPRAARTRKTPLPRPALSQQNQPSKFPALAIAASVSLLGIGWAIVHLRGISDDRTPVLTKVSGTVDRPAGPISLGESLSTGSHSSAVVTYPDGSVLEVLPDSKIVVAKRSSWDRSKGIEVVFGEVEAEVAPQPKGNPMVFTSKDASAEVVGTKLSFRCDDRRTRLDVTQGAVRFVPWSGGDSVLVEKGHFAEAGESGFRSGSIAPVLGITGFTLMNAESDQPVRRETLVDGETISLASLPTRKINIRADFDGSPPATVRISVTRLDGDPTGLAASTSADQKYPPFFAAGDYWPEGRPLDCKAWTPRPGIYQLSAEATYLSESGENQSKPLTIDIQITE